MARFHHHIVVETVAVDHDGAKTRIGNVHARTIRQFQLPVDVRMSLRTDRDDQMEVSTPALLGYPAGIHPAEKSGRVCSLGGRATTGNELDELADLDLILEGVA